MLNPMAHDSGRPANRKLRLYACAVCRQFTGRLSAEQLAVLAVCEALADGEATDEALNKAKSRDREAAPPVRDIDLAVLVNMRCACNSSWGGDFVARHTLEYALSLGPHLDRTFADLLRDTFGNPFRPAVLPAGEVPCPDCVPGVPDEYCDDCGGAGITPAPCPWITPDVRSLAEAAYRDRAGRTCEACRGRGKSYCASGCDPDAYPNCYLCAGTGTAGLGQLDPHRLLVLADALEEAGAEGGRCQACYGGQVWVGGSPYDSYEREPCPACHGSGRLAHPLLEHLRSGTPKYPGTWSLDLVLGCR